MNKKAYCIRCNDSIEEVIVDDGYYANKRKEKLQLEHYKKNLWQWENYTEYKKTCLWHIDEVKVIANPDPTSRNIEICVCLIKDRTIESVATEFKLTNAAIYKIFVKTMAVAKNYIRVENYEKKNFLQSKGCYSRLKFVRSNKHYYLPALTRIPNGY